MVVCFYLAAIKKGALISLLTSLRGGSFLPFWCRVRLTGGGVNRALGRVVSI